MNDKQVFYIVMTGNILAVLSVGIGFGLKIADFHDTNAYFFIFGGLIIVTLLMAFFGKTYQGIIDRI